jgi:hypothetical protein
MLRLKTMPMKLENRDGLVLGNSMMRPAPAPSAVALDAKLSGQSPLAHAVSRSEILGGCRPGLLAQRSRFSMTLAWLGRRGGGGFGSSDSLRGSLIFSVMVVLPS